jgi:hypothetical protein
VACPDRRGLNHEDSVLHRSAVETEKLGLITSKR